MPTRRQSISRNNIQTMNDVSPVQREETIEQIRARHENRQRRKKKRRRVRRMFFLTVVLCIALLCVMFLTPFFKISHIEVTGNKQVTAEQICKAGAVQMGQNLFAVRTDTMEKSIESLPFVHTVKVSRKLPKTLKIVVKERTICCYIKSNEVYYAIDEEGIVLDKPTELDAHYPCLDGLDVKGGEVGDAIALLKENQTTALPVVVAAAKEEEVLDKIALLNLTDANAITFVYDNRLTVDFGDLENANRKMAYLKEVASAQTGAGTVRFDMDKGKTYFEAAVASATEEPTEQSTEESKEE